MSENTLHFKVERVYRLPDTGPVKAFVDLGINEAILIKGLKVVKGPKGLFVSMPQEQGKDKRWYDSIRCLTPEIRYLINEKVIKAYQEEESH